jgi:ArsR family transcriptional regulator
MRMSGNMIETRIPMVDHMMENAEKTARFLKSLAHPARLVILCRLSEAPASVGELENTLQLAQPIVSKLLGQLRKEGLVTTQRDGRSIIYHLADDRTRQIVGKLYEQFCD